MNVSGYLFIAASTAIIYIFILLAMRLFGKTEVAQLSIVDLVFILLISNAVQNAMVAGDTTLLGGIVAASTLFIMDFLFKTCLYRVPWFNKLLQGSPLVLVRHGQVEDKNLKHAMLTKGELMETLREHGVEDVKDVDLAVLEVDGNISVLSEQFKAESTSKKRHATRRETKKV